MEKQRISKRLDRLVHCGLCQGDDATEYATKLRQLAEHMVDSKFIGRQSKLFKALADQTRLRILSLLQAREMCVCELMIALDLTQPTTSHHLRILENVALVKNRKRGKWVFYSLTDPRLAEKISKLELV
jgi:ArsR family transcriptional regulator